MGRASESGDKEGESEGEKLSLDIDTDPDDEVGKEREGSRDGQADEFWRTKDMSSLITFITLTCFPYRISWVSTWSSLVLPVLAA